MYLKAATVVAMPKRFRNRRATCAGRSLQLIKPNAIELFNLSTCATVNECSNRPRDEGPRPPFQKRPNHSSRYITVEKVLAIPSRRIDHITLIGYWLNPVKWSFSLLNPLIVWMPIFHPAISTLWTKSRFGLITFRAEHRTMVALQTAVSKSTTKYVSAIRPNVVICKTKNSWGVLNIRVYDSAWRDIPARKLRLFQSVNKGLQTMKPANASHDVTITRKISNFLDGTDRISSVLGVSGAEGDIRSGFALNFNVLSKFVLRAHRPLFVFPVQ